MLRARFLEDQARRRVLYGDGWALDELFLAASGKLLPCVGVAFGFDRLTMLACWEVLYW
jgi:elongation factor P--beta-lysine ligase